MVVKNPLWTLVCFILNQFLHDQGAILTMTVCQSTGLLELKQLMHVPLEWEPKGKFQCRLNVPYGVDWEPTDSSTSSPENHPVPTTTVIDRTKPLKWAWIELMPVPVFLFSQIWKLLYFYMRIFGTGSNKGILVVRHDRKIINLSVSKHEGSLIVIERQQG